MGWGDERDEEIEEARIAEILARRGAPESPPSDALKAVFARADKKQVWATVEGIKEFGQVTGMKGARGDKPEVIIVQTRDGDKSARVWTDHELPLEVFLEANPEFSGPT